MIGKVVVGKSFRGCLLYCLNDKKQGLDAAGSMKERAEILMFNQCYGNQKELVAQFNEVRQLNPKLSKPVMHITLSLAPGESLGKDRLMEMAQQCALDMGFANNQFIAIHHNDTGHQHMHIVANRVGFDKRTVSDSNSYQKIAGFCRKMELRYELKQVLNPNRYLSKEQRRIPRADLRKELMKRHIREAINTSKFYHEFEQRMKAKGYQVIKGRGIAFIDPKKVRMKGSDLNYPLQTIERILEKNRRFSLKEARGNLEISNQIEPYKQLPVQEPAEQNRGFHLEQNNSLLKDLINDLAKVIFEVMAPQESVDFPPKQFQKKKKRKKRLRQSGH